MKIIYFLCLLSAIILYGCSTVKPSGDLLLKAELVKIDSWINLMPGSQETFHINGIIRLINQENSDIDSLHIEMAVIQNGVKIYSVYPEMDPVLNGNKELKKEEEKEFTFTSGKYFLLKKELNYNLPVVAEFTIKAKGKEYIFKTQDITIEKAF